MANMRTAAIAIRVANAKREDYERFMKNLENDMKPLEIGREAAEKAYQKNVSQNWVSLKEREGK